MLHPAMHRSPPPVAASLAFAASLGALAAQDALKPIVATAPSGFNKPPGSGPADLADMLDGFSCGAVFTTLYDSNVTQSPGLPVAPVEDDIVMSIAPSVRYRSLGKEWFVAAQAGFAYNEYFELSQYSGFDYHAGFQVGYDGPKLNTTFGFNYSFDQGVNRYYSSFIEQNSFSTSLSASYELSAKTSLDSSVGFSWNDPTTGASGGTENFNLQTAAMWQATPLIRIGPGIRYSMQSGDYQSDRTTLGPILRANYRLSTKVSLNSQLGLDFVEYKGAGGGSDESVSASIGLNYQASRLWGLSFSLLRATEADGSTPGAYREVLSIQTGVHRRIRRATLQLSLGWETNDYVRPVAALGTPGSRDFLTIGSTLSMPVFSNRAVASVFFRYANEDSAAFTQSWDGCQFGFSIGASF